MAQHFLKNPGFELGDKDWTKGTGWAISNDAGNSRSGAWVANKPAATDSSINKTTAESVRPGLKISASVWLKMTADYDTGSDLVITWQDKDGTSISSVSSGSVAAGTTVYTQASVNDAVAPDRAKSAIIRVRSGTATLGTLYADDADMSGDIIESIPASATIRSHRMIPIETVARFDPLVGSDKFTEFNSGMSDKWSGVYTFVPALDGDLGELLSFIRRLGKTERFFAYDPDRTAPVNGVVNGMQVDGAVSAGSTKIPVKSGPVSSTALVAGDYIEVKDQYFKLMRDLEIGPEGTGEAVVWPAVRSAIADNEDVITSSPVMVARITSDLDWRRVEHNPTEVSFSWEEV